jgi:exodeoxyribonuclease V alpha subunit
VAEAEALANEQAAQAAGDNTVVSIEGVLERITYSNGENGYTIAKLKLPRQKTPITIAGNMPSVNVGETLRLTGKWTLHAQYGRQFTVSRYEVALPGTIPGLKKYLGSGLLKGVGPAIAEQLVSTFGFDTVEVLERYPERLAQIPGLGSRRAVAIAHAWREQRALKEVMEFLQAQGLPVTLAVRIVKRYGEAAAVVVRDQPYRLTEEVYGVSFSVADQIANRLGVAPETPQRIWAGVKHVLGEAAENGHTWMRRAELVGAAARLLGQAALTVEQELARMVSDEQIMIEPGEDGGEVVYPAALYNAEAFVAGAIKALKSHPHDRLSDCRHIEWRKAIAYLQAHDPGLRTLTERQQQAVRLALTEPVTILTGGPGTGKTTTLRAIIKLMAARKHSVVLAAPTGRAAKRLEETTGASARTLHRLLDLHPTPSGEYGRGAQIDADLVIVDEASMMDLLLAQALLRAVPPGAHVLLVGDPDQLPSVGAGNVLQDMLASEAVPTVRLTTIFRQSEESGIVGNAHLINAGELPQVKGFKDFFFLSESVAETAAATTVDLACRRLPAKYGCDPFEDVQVITPTYQGAAGVDALNVRLQERLNPPAPGKGERRYGERIFREGDKVMQVCNDYDRQVFNGDIGRIVMINHEEQMVRVLFDNEWSAVYTFSELDELTHAYAISVHKSQGSEYPVVVLPLLRAHGRLLQRHLLYTGISRARQLVVLVGEPDALRRAVANTASAQRNTGLRRRLVG